MCGSSLFALAFSLFLVRLFSFCTCLFLLSLFYRRCRKIRTQFKLSKNISPVWKSCSRTDLDLIQLWPPRWFLPAKLLNTKVVENFSSFPESTRTQESEFVWEIYGRNTKLDREDSDLDAPTWLKRTRYDGAKLKLNQKYYLNQQHDID